MSAHELEELHLRLANSEWSRRWWRRLAIVSTSLLALLLVAGAVIGPLTVVALHRERQRALAERDDRATEVSRAQASLAVMLKTESEARQKAERELEDARRATEAAEEPGEP